MRVPFFGHHPHEVGDYKVTLMASDSAGKVRRLTSQKCS